MSKGAMQVWIRLQDMPRIGASIPTSQGCCVLYASWAQERWSPKVAFERAWAPCGRMDYAVCSRCYMLHAKPHRKMWPKAAIHHFKPCKRQSWLPISGSFITARNTKPVPAGLQSHQSATAMCSLLRPTGKPFVAYPSLPSGNKCRAETSQGTKTPARPGALVHARAWGNTSPMRALPNRTATS